MTLQVQWLATELWDIVRERLGDAEVELHLYGAYPSAAAQRLHDPVGLILGCLCSVVNFRTVHMQCECMCGR